MTELDRRAAEEGDGCVQSPVRSVLRFEALVILAVLLGLYWRTHANWLMFILVLFVPDVAMLGYLRDTRIGAWSYNAFHSYVGPGICLAASIWVPVLLPIAMVWAAHIAMDRALGYGLKYGDSFQHTHLGFIGKAKR